MSTTEIPQTTTSTSTAAEGGCPVSHGSGQAFASAARSSGGGCPIDHSAYAKKQQEAAESSPKSESACPVDHSQWTAVTDGDGGNKVDVPQTNPRLSNVAVSSSIPKASGDDETWTFPSPQRFYNAVSKKGWEADVDDIAAVVSIHNTVNERCWKKILAYESLHAAECPNPKLASFKRVYGKTEDLSPKTRMYSALGYTLPYDRHDWTVDRCGTHVRYVLDFYEGRASNDGRQSMYVDVRPALDSFGAAVDRLRVSFREFVGYDTP